MLMPSFLNPLERGTLFFIVLSLCCMMSTLRCTPAPRPTPRFRSEVSGKTHTHYLSTQGLYSAEAPLGPWKDADGGEASDAGGTAVARLRADARRLEELCEALRGFRPPGTAAAFPPAAKGAKVLGLGLADTAPASRPRSAWVGAPGISPQCITLPSSASASTLPSSQGGASRPRSEQQRVRPRMATGVGAVDQLNLAAAGGAEPGGEPGGLPSPPAQRLSPKMSQREVASAAAEDRVALGRGADALPRPRSQPAIAQARYSRSLPSSRGASRSGARAERRTGRQTRQEDEEERTTTARDVPAEQRR